MEEARRIYTLLLRNNGLKIREIALALDLEKLYVAEILFSEECSSFWYQNDDSLWFAIEGALQNEEEEEEEEQLEDIVFSNPYDIEQYITEEHSESFRIYLKVLSNYGTISNEDTRMLFERYRDGDNKAFDLLVKSNMKHVLGLALYFKREGVEFEDLMQEGCIGLIQSIQQYDHTIGRGFYQYAKRGILRTIGSSQLYLPYLIRIPPSIILRHHYLNKKLDKLEQEFEYEPSPTNVEHDGYTEGRPMPYYYKLPYDLRSITKHIEDLDFIEGNFSAPDEELMLESRKVEANNYLNLLGKRQKKILELFFGINGKEETLEEIGRRFNLTRERVRQIKEKAISILRRKIHVDKKKDSDDTKSTPTKGEIGKKRDIVDSQPYSSSTTLRHLVDLKLLTKKELKRCNHKKLKTIGDVQGVIEKYDLTRDSSRFSQYTLDILFKIVDLLHKESKLQTENKKTAKSVEASSDDKFNYYCEKIDKLKQAKVRNEVIVAKPVLLLALIDGIDYRIFIGNRFQLNDWLEDYYEKLMRRYSKNSVFEKMTAINLPFWHLQNDGFWHLHYYGEELCDKYTPTTNGLKKSVEYASLDDDLWLLLENNEIRKQMRNYIVQKKLSTTQINQKETIVKATEAKPIAVKSTPAIAAKENKTGSRDEDRKRAVMDVMRKLTEPKSALDIAFLVSRVEWGGVVVCDEVEDILNNIRDVGKTWDGEYYLKSVIPYKTIEKINSIARKRKELIIRVFKRLRRPLTPREVASEVSWDDWGGTIVRPNDVEAFLRKMSEIQSINNGTYKLRDFLI